MLLIETTARDDNSSARTRCTLPALRSDHKKETQMMYDIASIDALLQKQFPGRVKRHEVLAVHSSAGVGGPADFWVELHTPEEGERLTCLCAQSQLPLLVIGNGSNILFADGGVRGVVARMAAKSYRFEEQHRGTALAVIDSGMEWS